MDFVAIDFETANSNRASACAVGLVKVSNGQIVDSYFSLIRPYEQHNWENFWNFNVHKIPFADYQEAPSFDQIWPEIERFIGSLPVFAHNSAFDKSVLEKTLGSWGIESDLVDFRCSMLLAQRVLKSKADVSLPALADKFGISGLKHHDALSDAETCAEIVQSLLQIEPDFNFETLNLRTPRTRLSSKLEGDKAFIEKAKQFIDSPDNGVIGRTFTFTGTLSLGTRSELIGLVEGLGGAFIKKTSKKTNVLVQGAENPNSFAAGHSHSSSYETAEALRAEGAEVETIFEDQFLELIPGEFFEKK